MVALGRPREPGLAVARWRVGNGVGKRPVVSFWASARWSMLAAGGENHEQDGLLFYLRCVLGFLLHPKNLRAGRSDYLHLRSSLDRSPARESSIFVPFTGRSERRLNYGRPLLDVLVTTKEGGNECG